MRFHPDDFPIKPNDGARRPLTAGGTTREYDRIRDLPRLLPLWPEELTDFTLGGRARLVSRLLGHLRRERARGLSGDWSYDISRHRQLLVVFQAEVRLLQQLKIATAADDTS